MTSLGRRAPKSKDETRIQVVCRQAKLLGQSGRYRDAQDLLLDLDRQYPNRGEVWQILGWTYKRQQPPKVTDAQYAFARAEQLGRRRTDLYWHWAELEEQFGSPGAAVAIAERGLTELQPSVSLNARAASARIARAQTELDFGQAEADLVRAQELIAKGFDLPLERYESPGLRRILTELSLRATRRLAEVRDARSARDRSMTDRQNRRG